MKILVNEKPIDVCQHPRFCYYAASQDGRIFTRPCVRPRGIPRRGPRPRAKHWKEIASFIVQPKHTPPYRKSRITQDGKTYLVSVYRFMLECWEGEQPRSVITRHLDGDSLNNNLWNLKYGTVQENVKDTFEHTGNYAEGERNGRASLTANDVRSIRKRFDAGERITSIHKDFDRVSTEAVGYAARRQTWIHVK